jgi:hypothetical protein
VKIELLAPVRATSPIHRKIQYLRSRPSNIFLRGATLCQYAHNLCDLGVFRSLSASDPLHGESRDLLTKTSRFFLT